LALLLLVDFFFVIMHSSGEISFYRKAKPTSQKAAPRAVKKSSNATEISPNGRVVPILELRGITTAPKRKTAIPP